MLQLLLLLFLLLVSPIAAFQGEWTMDDFALFDLVEEIAPNNFYKLLNLEREASTGDIKKAYRRLSLVWHPDRNSDQGAEDMFRKIAAVYEVLKSDEARDKYNHLLEYGLPDWRQPIYYYRHVRKMPAWETAILLLLICTFGHYAVLWANYFELRLALTDTIANRLRKKDKALRRKKNNDDVDNLVQAELDEQLAMKRPLATNVLPLILIRACIALLCSLPRFVQHCYAQYCCPALSDTADIDDEQEQQRQRPRPPSAPRVDFHYSVATDINAVSTVDVAAMQRRQLQMAAIAGGRRTDDDIDAGEWTFDELALLVKLSTAKYPAGTLNRWEKIAAALNRRADAVTTMIGKLKNMDPKEYQKLCDGPAPSDNLILKHSPSDQLPVSVPTLADDGGDGSNDVVWGQTQQKLFEQSLQQFPKGTAERWEKISRCVPGKTKEECISRYKELAELVRQRKNKNSH